MHLFQSIYNHIKEMLNITQFISFYKFRIKKILSIIIRYYIPTVGVFILVFSTIYYITNGLRFNNTSEDIITFLDCYYFSAITFFTLGFGDIIPYTNFGKTLVIIQEFFSFIILTLFSGFIIPIFFVRRDDISYSDQLYICYNGSSFNLSFPIVNKGYMFYEMQGALSFTLCNQQNIVSRYSLINSYTTWFKKIWFCDFEISIENSKDENYMILYEVIYLAITNQIDKLHDPKFKLCIHGVDSHTRSEAYFIKEYYIHGTQLTFSNTRDLPQVQKKYKSSSIKNWYATMKDNDFYILCKLLQEILFPEDIPKRDSLTCIYQIENRHVDKNWSIYKKNYVIP
ncbi:hypothetical protein GC105_09335 [Alkalibaculum sp. M08DMB]|uniref:Potassium channel domain-containing protein n=1 Tax=Alkalibaculum sporogenes TaxID=2655001 RepID=A0A6A7KAC9_9FIRM|nr:potassium channel family protein [Alkalibaculum sporogenes]MPW25993.1 hypothetical protein [Alkalibaculum sporogenes]